MTEPYACTSQLVVGNTEIFVGKAGRAIKKEERELKTAAPAPQADVGDLHAGGRENSLRKGGTCTRSC